MAWLCIERGSAEQLLIVPPLSHAASPLTAGFLSAAQGCQDTSVGLAAGNIEPGDLQKWRLHADGRGNLLGSPVNMQVGLVLLSMCWCWCWCCHLLGFLANPAARCPQPLLRRLVCRTRGTLGRASGAPPTWRPLPPP